jgi:predicted double-glycine peptidase
MGVFWIRPSVFSEEIPHLTGETTQTPIGEGAEARQNSVEKMVVIALDVGGARMRVPVQSLNGIKKRNVIFQRLDYSCGAASLAMLLNHYFGDNVTEEEIIHFILQTGDLYKIKEQEGFSLLDLKRFTQNRGYQVYGYRMNFGELIALQKPVLIPVKINFDHFVVFRGMEKERVFLADPVAGNITLPLSRFIQVWTGPIGLVVEKPEQAPQSYPLRITPEEAIFMDTQLLPPVFKMAFNDITRRMP